MRERARTRSAHFTYVPTLDGWRAIAVLAVIFYHCLHNGLNPDSVWARLAVRGHLGVDVFFAISGFLICGKLLREREETHTVSLKRFYLKRLFRIFPPVWAYLAVLAVLAGVGWVSTQNWEFVSTLFFTRNYLPTFDGEPIGTYTAQFWSLAVEEHFYLLWPMIVLLLGSRPRRLGWIAGIAAVAIFVWRLIDGTYGLLIPYGSSVDMKTDTRMDALLWGCLAAIIYPRLQSFLQARPVWKNISLPLSLFTLAIIFWKAPVVTLFEGMLFPALLMSTAIFPNGVFGKFLESPVMRWIGRLSYSIYIWQQLFIFPVSPGNSPVASLQHFPYNIALIFLLASISYYLVERPLIRLGHKLTKLERRPSYREQVALS